MKIFDCFMFYDEELLLELRLNYLDKYVDYFVISEAKYNHKGEKKNLNFKISQFNQFKKKIIYIVTEENPPDLKNIDLNDSEITKKNKNIFNGYARDIFQRQNLAKGFRDASDEDFILISDIDEIPKMENLNKSTIDNNIFCFKQNLHYYKFNLLYKDFFWFGTKGCKKKYLRSPQWLREVKSRKYPFYRLDIIFSKKKKRNIKHVNDGGWHFSYLKKPEQLYQKLKSFAHYYEFEQSGLKFEDVKKIIEERRIIYDHSVDQRADKWNSNIKLKRLSLDDLPDEIKKNYDKYSDFID